MLTSKDMDKVRRLEEQTGPSEGTFSPRWHASPEGQRPSPGSIGSIQQETVDAVGQFEDFTIEYATDPNTGVRRLVRRPVAQATLNLGYAENPDTGDVTIVRRDQPLPEGYKLSE